VHANRYRFGALTPDALYAVTNLVHRAWRAVLGPVNIREYAKCPAQRLAIVCHATNVALRPSRVVIDVQEFVVKCARKGIVINALINSSLESTSLK
jgi:hypothetical protein